MNKINIILLFSICCIVFSCKVPKTSSDLIEAKVDSLLSLMTLEEKAGQLNMAPQELSINPESKEKIVLDDEILKGRIGAIINPRNIDENIRLQKIAVTQSRLRIPLLFATDVIHGYKTIFPIPLAQAASWDLVAIENAERIAATEASASGIHWTFAPMVDISRDARWGRVSEGAGEDTYLNSLIAVARVKGFQGKQLGDTNSVMACMKHFAGYGAIEGGREYNTTDMSEVALRNYYLPPFKAGVDAQAATVMNAFTTVNHIPASASELLVKQILKTEWGFKGFTISDWGSFFEMIDWGYASDSYDAAYKCIRAKSDMDMGSYVYINGLPQLVRDGKVKESELDESVRRVLRKKFELGLFEDPFKYTNKEREKNSQLRPEFLRASLEMSQKSFVLLKNSTNLLPLSKDIKNLAIIGPLADSRLDNDYIGTWSSEGKSDNIVTVVDAVKKKLNPNTKFLYAQACQGYGNCPDTMFNRSIEVARKADVVVLCLGESGYMSNENASRTNIDLLPKHQELLEKIHAMGKPIILVLFTGRPLTINWAAENIPSILLVWRPGTMGGQAIADALFGDYNPSGKLPITFPRTVGQIPIYYNQLNTGRPHVKGWSDVPNTPLYPFGYGLSYTQFAYSKIKLEADTIAMNDSVRVSAVITNTGKVLGKEIAQLYIRDWAADIARPVKELKGYKILSLKPGESSEVKFTLSQTDLAYWNTANVFKADAGKFSLFVGTSSANCEERLFWLK